jgi:hypothetical protein
MPLCFTSRAGADRSEAASLPSRGGSQGADNPQGSVRGSTQTLRAIPSSVAIPNKKVATIRQSFSFQFIAKFDTDGSPDGDGTAQKWCGTLNRRVVPVWPTLVMAGRSRCRPAGPVAVGSSARSRSCLMTAARSRRGGFRAIADRRTRDLALPRDACGGAHVKAVTAGQDHRCKPDRCPRAPNYALPGYASLMHRMIG